MQTFLLSTDFRIAAQQLDNYRLGKQRVECLQILKALTDPKYGWQNHPAVKMYRSWEWPLWGYAAEICDEWVGRGYKDTCWEKICDLMDDVEIVGLAIKPDWLTEEFASNHRSVMLGKALEAKNLAWDAYYNNEELANVKLSRKHDKACDVWTWYKQFNWTEQPAQRVNGKWPYLWPEVA